MHLKYCDMAPYCKREIKDIHYPLLSLPLCIFEIYCASERQLATTTVALCRKAKGELFEPTTRLILIVSKPIMIVVVLVVIDVVFVKKKLGPKKFWLKKIHVQKTLCQNNFG